MQEESAKRWEATSQQYNKYLEELPDHPPVEELQEFVTNLFMAQFVRLGKAFNLNRNFDM